jgi:N-methylhydantoinase A/oxoprolinase/acetone carboxylase beta subunit
MLVVGIDVGGTFTDLVLFDSASGRVAVTKTSSTANQADGVLDAMRRLEVTTSQLDRDSRRLPTTEHLGEHPRHLAGVARRADAVFDRLLIHG